MPDNLDYDFSIPFDSAKTSDVPQVWSLADSLIEELLPDLKRSRQAYRQNMVTILLNLFTAHQHHPDLFVAYSRDRSRYRAKDRYNPLGISYTCLTTCADALESAVYAEGARGIHYPGYQRRARLRASEELQELFQEYGLDLSMVRREFEPVVLRNGEGCDTAYSNTPQLRAMHRRLERINAMLSALEVHLPLSPKELRSLTSTLGQGRDNGEKPPFDLTRRTLHRVFNRGKFNLGGRFYGHWAQALPKAYRRRLLMEGEPVCEWDFSGMALNMLYLREGLDLPEGDVYSLNDPSATESRETIKKGLQILLNCSDEKEAAQALKNTTEFKTSGAATQALELFLLPELRDRHHPIAHHFGTGVGLSLQYDDSRIAEAIVLDLMGQGIPCIPVHDSFIVQARHSDTLAKAMTRHSQEVLGQPLPMTRKY